MLTNSHSTHHFAVVKSLDCFGRFGDFGAEVTIRWKLGRNKVVVWSGLTEGVSEGESYFKHKEIFHS